MWGYIKVNDTWYECDRCGSVVRDTKKHSNWHSHYAGDDTPLFELSLPVRVDTAMRRYGILTVEGMIADIDKDDNVLYYLLDFRNIGYKTAEQALCILQERGIVDSSGQLIKE